MPGPNGLVPSDIPQFMPRSAKNFARTRMKSASRKRGSLDRRNAKLDTHFFHPTKGKRKDSPIRNTATWLVYHLKGGTRMSTADMREYFQNARAGSVAA